ncbi:hypothetical protein WL1483_3781 [Aeromonas schubertii]|uniref:Uncharacterized protein n=1 Tax=Aeromonas schubertii TaxID=652 RepID=A0A0S2SN91_9GAMM|nr:hypothetical protein WL1483_3781 [Aeromonas schubertii]
MGHTFPVESMEIKFGSIYDEMWLSKTERS